METSKKLGFLKQKALPFWLLLLGLFGGLLILYVWLMNPDVVGLVYDDGMYFLAAKSLLQGDGYRLLHITDTPLFYKYPPLFPAFLAILMKISSSASHPIFWLKTGNIALSLGALALLYRILRKVQKLPDFCALGIILTLGTQWPYIETSVELMSEPLFLLLSFLLIDQVDSFDKNPTSKKSLGLIILLSAFCFYSRTMGSVLIAAITLWLFSRQHRKIAFYYAISTGLLCLPWLLWTRQRPDTTLAIGDFFARSFQETYWQSFLIDLRYEYTPWELYGKGIETLVSNFSTYFFKILPPISQIQSSVILLVVLALSLALLILLVKYALSHIQQKHFSLLGLYTGLYLLILPFWSYFPFYPRFLLLVLPFLIGFLCQAIFESSYSDKAKKMLVSGFILFALTSNLITLIPYLKKPYPNVLYLNTSLNLWQEYQSIFSFINQKTPSNAVFYSDNTDETYLYATHTNRYYTDFFIFLPKATLAKIQATQGDKNAISYFIQKRADATYEALKQTHVNYFIAHQFQKTFTRQAISKTLPITSILLQKYANEFKPVAHSPNGFITVYEFIPKQ